jgi:hypothetical protein
VELILEVDPINEAEAPISGVLEHGKLVPHLVVIT